MTQIEILKPKRIQESVFYEKEKPIPTEDKIIKYVKIIGFALLGIIMIVMVIKFTFN